MAKKSKPAPKKRKPSPLKRAALAQKLRLAAAERTARKYHAAGLIPCMACDGRGWHSANLRGRMGVGQKKCKTCAGKGMTPRWLNSPCRIHIFRESLADIADYGPEGLVTEHEIELALERCKYVLMRAPAAPPAVP